MPKSRVKIPDSVRNRLLIEVGHRCVRCLSDIPEVDLHHMGPLAEGGDNSEENLVVLCPTCHRLAHRYKLSAHQLRTYKECAIEGRNRKIIGESQALRESPPSADLLPVLQSSVEGWYNDLVRTASVSLRGGPEAEMAQFEYVHSRRFLPHVVAIRDVLAARGEYSEIVSDVDVLLSVLTKARGDLLS